MRKFMSIVFITTLMTAMSLTGCNEPNPPPPPDTVATPTATPSSGEVADNTEINLATTTAGAAIYYTQDNTEPTVASTLYGEGNKPVITIGKLILKAIAVKDGMNNSEVMTATYTIATVTPPTVTITNANQTKTLAPDLVIELSATVTQGTNPIQSKEWTLKNATADGVTPVFADKTAATTTVTGIKKAGTFVFELKVKDTTGVEGIAEVTVVVNPWNATKTVTVNSKTITLPAAKFDFNPLSYTPDGGDWGVFDQSKITFTLTDNKGGYTYRTDGIVEPNVYFNGNPWPGPITKQTFYYDGKEITGISRSIMLINQQSLNGFDYVIEPTDTEGDYPYDSSHTFPPITLTLSKTITEILPPPITKTVTVTLPSFTPLGSTKTSLDLNPIKGDNWDGFDFSKLSIILKETDPNGNSTTWFNFNNGIVTGKDPLNIPDWPPPVDSNDSSVGYATTITISFKYEGDNLGTYSFRTRIRTTGTICYFNNIYEYSQSNYVTDYVSLSVFPPITLTLSKPGTW